MAELRRDRTIDDLLELTRRYSNWGRWGPEDEIGTLNFVTPEAVAAAAAEVLTGQVISLAIPFNQHGPQRGGLGRFNPLHFMMRDGGDAITGAYQDWYGGRDRYLRGTDDVIMMGTHTATHWDSLAHIVHIDRIYNGYPASMVTSMGAKRNGLEKSSDRIVARGVLLDIPRARGRAWLEPGDGITSADLEEAATRQGVEVRQGDIVLVRTGQMAMVRDRGQWGDYAGGPAPGLALDALEWIHSHSIAGLATDTWGAEVLPNETPDVFQPIHIVAIVYMGLLVGEIFDLEALGTACAGDGRYSFFFAAPPLPITGAVGSPANPQAIR